MQIKYIWVRKCSRMSYRFVSQSKMENAKWPKCVLWGWSVSWRWQPSSTKENIMFRLMCEFLLIYFEGKQHLLIYRPGVTAGITVGSVWITSKSWAHFDFFLFVDALLVQVDLQPIGSFSWFINQVLCAGCDSEEGVRSGSGLIFFLSSLFPHFEKEVKCF